MNGPVIYDSKERGKKNAKTGGDDQCQNANAGPPPVFRSPLTPPPPPWWWWWWWRRRREGKGWGLLLGVELVLQLHELPGSFDLVGNLLPLREETLALLEGQALRSVTGDGVLLLLTATRV